MSTRIRFVDACSVHINMFLRSISKIDDYKMVSCHSRKTNTEKSAFVSCYISKNYIPCFIPPLKTKNVIKTTNLTKIYIKTINFV